MHRIASFCPGQRKLIRLACASSINDRVGNSPLRDLEEIQLPQKVTVTKTEHPPTSCLGSDKISAPQYSISLGCGMIMTLEEPFPLDAVPSRVRAAILNAFKGRCPSVREMAEISDRDW
ncbi:hypothetical protein, partial [Microvirga tunisiensis]|uniref:hypothetical protein n=1 Tax=Microvirga tunisiensis TaxID=2108360 RepID=UPI001AEDE582